MTMTLHTVVSGAQWHSSCVLF